MKIQGSKTTREWVDVEVSPYTLIDTLVKTIKSKIIPKEYIGKEEHTYINQEGFWEGWSNGHGSGYTSTYRKATVEEKGTWEKINDFDKIAKIIIKEE